MASAMVHDVSCQIFECEGADSVGPRVHRGTVVCYPPPWGNTRWGSQLAESRFSVPARRGNKESSVR